MRNKNLKCAHSPVEHFKEDSQSHINGNVIMHAWKWGEWRYPVLPTFSNGSRKCQKYTPTWTLVGVLRTLAKCRWPCEVEIPMMLERKQKKIVSSTIRLPLCFGNAMHITAWLFPGGGKNTQKFWLLCHTTYGLPALTPLHHPIVIRLDARAIFSQDCSSIQVSFVWTKIVERQKDAKQSRKKHSVQLRSGEYSRGSLYVPVEDFFRSFLLRKQGPEALIKLFAYVVSVSVPKCRFFLSFCVAAGLQ